jgi:hypothetical protein
MYCRRSYVFGGALPLKTLCTLYIPAEMYNAIHPRIIRNLFFLHKIHWFDVFALIYVFFF